MKFNKIISICKKQKCFGLYEDTECQWLGDGMAIYPLYDHPEYTKDSLAAVASMSYNEFSKMHFISGVFPETLSNADCTKDEQMCEVYDLVVSFNGGTTYILVSTSEGIRFMNAKYITPFIKEDWEIYERHMPSGQMYFVIKIGLVLHAIVLAQKDHITEADAELFDSLSDEITNALSIIQAKEKYEKEMKEQITNATLN